MAAEKSARHRAQRPVGFLLIVLLVILGGYLLKTLLTDELRPQLIENLPSNVDLELQQVHYSQNDNGVKNWVLDADRAAYQLDDDLLMLTGVKMTFFRLDHFGNIELTARTGNLHRQQKFLDLNGDVEMKTQTGEVFKSKSLHCDLQKRIVTTTDPVDLEGPVLHLSGKGMTLTLNDGILQISENIHAKIILQSAEGGRL